MTQKVSRCVVRCARRHQHGVSLAVPTATSVRAVPAKRFHRQPGRHQQLPAACAVERSASPTSSGSPWSGTPRNAGDEQRLLCPRRQALSSSPRPTSTSGWLSTCPSPTAAGLAGPQHQGHGVDADFVHFLDRLRGRRPEGPRQQADRRGLPGHHHHPDQPGHHRHEPLGAATWWRARARSSAWAPSSTLPSGRARARDDQPQRGQQDPHADQHLRPPHHPGRAERRLPADRPSLLLGEQGFYDEIRVAADPLRADPLVQGHLSDPRRRHQQGRPGPGAHPRIPGPRPPHGRYGPAGVPAAQARRPSTSPPTGSASGTPRDLVVRDWRGLGRAVFKLRRILGILRDRTAARSASSTCISRTSTSAPGSRLRSRSCTRVRPVTSRCGSCTSSTPRRRSRRSSRPSSSARSGSRWRARSRSSPCSTDHAAPRTTGWTRSGHRAAAPRPPQRAGQHRR